jgi:hypothetical protein
LEPPAVYARPSAGLQALLRVGSSRSGRRNWTSRQLQWGTGPGIARSPLEPWDKVDELAHGTFMEFGWGYNEDILRYNGDSRGK